VILKGVFIISIAIGGELSIISPEEGIIYIIVNGTKN
jgi:hypothetical protein